MTLDGALDRLLTGVDMVPCGSKMLPLVDALERVLAKDQHAVLHVPPADNSAMDGYAVRVKHAGMALPVSQRITAGVPGSALASESVARIFTGASIPPGADAVVPQEDVVLQGDTVLLPKDVRLGQHIRRKSQDCAVGDLLLPAGRRLLPQDLGLLASQGIALVAVRPRLRVAVLCTGDELCEPGEVPLREGAIYNSNRPMLLALLTALGCEVIDCGIVKDQLSETQQALENAANSADLIISCGGVSVGEADHVRDAVGRLGELLLWKVAIKPGKPFAQGRVGETPFIGLPGNPASAFVTFVLLARPLIGRLQGRRLPPMPKLGARANFTVTKKGTRSEYLRVRLANESDGLWASAHDNQSSGILSSLSASHALALVPAGTTVTHGEHVDILPLDMLLF